MFARRWWPWPGTPRIVDLRQNGRAAISQEAIQMTITDTPARPAAKAIQRQCLKMAALLLLAVVAADAARAQAHYPNSTVRMISDSAPGSAVDTALRLVADGMT